MAKKIFMALAGMLVVVAGVAAVSAFEAHIINVTAHIENALAVATTPIEFGTVFPQEYLTKTFTVGLSTSFLAETNADDVSYTIAQKPKPIWPKPTACTQGYTTEEAARAYCIANPSNTNCCYLSLCPFLSKTTTDANDTSHVGYYNDPTPNTPNSGDEYCTQPVRSTSSVLHYSDTGWAGWSCPTGTRAIGGGVIDNIHPMGPQGVAEPGATIGGFTYPVFPHYTFPAGETGYVAQNGGTAQDAKIYVDCLANNPDATGKLTKVGSDITDVWTVDLKVPPVAGTVGQDWPASCASYVVPTDGANYGCDLWIEVTGISRI